MTIQRKDGQIIITLPASVDIEGVQRLINFLLYKEAVKDSNARQEDVDQLAREVNKIFSVQLEEKQLHEIRAILARYFADKVTEEMDRLWNDRGWTQETMREWANEHMRTKS